MCQNPAYGRHQLSQPMRIVGPIQFWREFGEKCLKITTILSKLILIVLNILLSTGGDPPSPLSCVSTPHYLKCLLDTHFHVINHNSFLIMALYNSKNKLYCKYAFNTQSHGYCSFDFFFLQLCHLKTFLKSMVGVRQLILLNL